MVKTLKKKQLKSEDLTKQTVMSPIGRFYYPTVVEARGDVGKEKFSTDLFVSVADMAKPAGQLFLKAVNTAISAKFGKGTTYEDVPDSPVVKLDEAPGHPKGCFRIRAKTSIDYPPTLKNAATETISADSKEAKKIKSGDYGRIAVSTWFYTYKGKEGLSLNLDLLQFWKSGEPIAGGSEKALKLVDELEVSEEDLEDFDDEDESEEEDDSEDSEDEEESEEEDEEDSNPFGDDEDEEEDEPQPVKKSKKSKK